jgi:hypothetical protein
MSAAKSVRCRIVACPDQANLYGGWWSFYLINDGSEPLENVVLDEVVYSWGDYPNTRPTSVNVGTVAPGAHLFIWRDDGDAAELRIDLLLHATLLGRELRLLAEFPRLYRLRNLPLVEELGKHGWTATVEKR